MEASTLFGPQLTLLNADGTASYRLTDGTPSTTDAQTLELVLSSFDFDELQKIENLATGTGNTFLTIASVVEDMNENTVTLLSTPKEASDFIDDAKAAALVSFDLDLTAETLTMLFSETMDETSVAPTQFTLQSGDGKSGAAAASYTLTDETSSVRIDDTTIVVSLVKTDLEEMKAELLLCTGEDNTYLSSARFPTEIYTRGCHWIPRMFA
jgi:hypothetical protein